MMLNNIGNTGLQHVSQGRPVVVRQEEVQALNKSERCVLLPLYLPFSRPSSVVGFYSLRMDEWC